MTGRAFDVADVSDLVDASLDQWPTNAGHYDEFENHSIGDLSDGGRARTSTKSLDLKECWLRY
jgi:hypothetical protein